MIITISIGISNNFYQGSAVCKLKLEDHLESKATVFAWQKQSILKRRNNSSLIMSAGQKFWQNRSMSHCFQDTSIFCVLQFLRKIRKFKMDAILMGQILF